MPSWYYFSRPTNEACHNLCTDHQPPWNYRGLLGLGLTFIPKPRYTNYNMTENTNRFRADMYTATFMAHHHRTTPRLFQRSNWTPPIQLINYGIRKRTENFITRIHGSFIKKKTRSNMLPFQRHILNNLRHGTMFVIFPADKNLGPCIIERDKYIQRALKDHLSDTTTYRQYSRSQALTKIEAITATLEAFIIKNKDLLQKSDINFLERTKTVKDPFAKFYITAKIHKQPWATRPIVSISGSILHGLGRWVDKILQPFAQAIPSYIKSSATLVDILSTMPPLPPNAKIFTADAVSMYTNINTRDAIARIRKLLDAHPTLATSNERFSVIEALVIIMSNNIFQFGDTYWLQIDGTAMGVSPSCSYATLYYAAHEQWLQSQYPEIIFYRRYIDDVFAIWHPKSPNDLERWTSFQQDLNKCGKLRWETTKQHNSINFLDIQITIESNRTLSTRLYEKKQNLYLYLPANSCHPPGCLKGLVYGMIYRTLTLTSNIDIQTTEIQNLYYRLVARGYQPSMIKPLIEKAYRNIMDKKKLDRSSDDPIPPLDQKREHIFFHTMFHPNNPSSKKIQTFFRQEMLYRLNKPNLNDLKNHESVPIGIRRLIVCYHRPPNLGNLLSPRVLKCEDGPLVSSYL
jgi:hypothetical protein